MAKPRSKTLGNFRKRTAERPADSDRNSRGQFVKGNSAGSTLGKQNNTVYGGVQAANIERDAKLHLDRSLAKNTIVARFQEFRNQTVQAYGGWDKMDPLSHHLLDMVTVGKVLIDSITNFVGAKNARLVNKRSRRTYPVVETLSRLMDAQTVRVEKFASLMLQERTPKDLTMDDIRRNLETDGETD